MLDPIVYKEKLQQAEKVSETAINKVDAARALVWFATYKPGGNGMTRTLQLAATGTPDVEFAQQYINQAVNQMREDIIERAVNLALLDFEG